MQGARPIFSPCYRGFGVSPAGAFHNSAPVTTETLTAMTSHEVPSATETPSRKKSVSTFEMFCSCCAGRDRGLPARAASPTGCRYRRRADERPAWRTFDHRRQDPVGVETAQDVFTRGGATRHDGPPLRPPSLDCLFVILNLVARFANACISPVFFGDTYTFCLLKASVSVNNTCTHRWSLGKTSKLRPQARTVLLAA